MSQKYQGDISLIAIQENKLPKGLKFKPFGKKEIVVAKGEVTGHCHLLKVLNYPKSKIEIAQDENGYYLRVDEGQAVLTHNKHGQQTTTGRGLYFIGRQVEYNELEGWRRVSD